ncbi:MAG TPA: HEAT repeat domain-containing protein [Deltaproteobacteria bacterium]|nr:HEAT repeat domain-containing protein [Deltaproteobacteria bacterium]
MDLKHIDSMISSEDSSLRREAATRLADIGGDEAFDRLAVLLKDANNGVRDAAQNSIIILGGRRAIEKMVALLTHEDPSIRNMAIDILRKIGDDGIDILHNLTHDPNDNIRLFVLDILGSIGNIESLDAIIEGLYDSNPNVRNASVISLGELGDPKAFDHLRKLINDEEWIRFSVIESLAQISHEETVDFLLNELDRWSNDEITMCAILEALGRIGSKKTVQPLIRMLAASSEYVEVSIVQTLLKILSVDDILSLDTNDRQMIKDILEPHLGEAEDDFQQYILDALAHIGDRKSAGHIIELARKVEPDIETEKWDCIKSALIRLGDTELMLELLEKDEKSKILGAEILAEIGTEKEGREIAKLIFGTQGYVKRALCDAIADIGGPSSREPLLQLIHDQDGHVITSSLRALGRIGKSEDIKDLVHFLVHPYPDVRAIALEAIASIGGEFAEQTFKGLLKDKDPQMRIMALTGLEGIHSEYLGEAVNYMSRDQDGQARMASVKIIFNAMLPIETDLLTTLLNDELDDIRYLAIDIIGQRRIDDFRSFLEEATLSDEIWMAYHAIEALGNFRDDEAKDKLLSILKDAQDFLRISAVKALGQWEDETLAAELEIYMDDDNLDVARAVAEAVDRLQGVAF